MSAQGPLSAPQDCSVSPDNRAALHATASCFAALHATASCFAIGYRDGIASPRPTACLEFPIKIGNTSPLACSLQEVMEACAHTSVYVFPLQHTSLLVRSGIHAATCE